MASRKGWEKQHQEEHLLDQGTRQTQAPWLSPYHKSRREDAEFWACIRCVSSFSEVEPAVWLGDNKPFRHNHSPPARLPTTNGHAV